MNIFYNILSLIPIIIILIYYVFEKFSFLNRFKYISRLRDIYFLCYWIFIIFTPTFLILIIRFSDILTSSLPRILFLILIFILPSIHFVSFLKYDLGNKKVVSSSKLKVIDTANYSSQKLMEFIVTMVLPFITLGNEQKDFLVGALIVSLLIIVVIKLRLYSFNLPLMLFFRVIKVQFKGKEWYLITDERIVDGNSYKVIPLIRSLRIAIALERFK
ncbi:hypothetical protein [Planococcus rifietoensis]|uniref:hypothetical protein n=1 Tax=Planococcus rifietoensis TaxID=200991 RepID=UPI00384BAAC9